MLSWQMPEVPKIPGQPVALSLYDTADEKVKEVRSVAEKTNQPIGMYVCGITPYDSTHLGHAATYLTFDLINRVLRDNDQDVHYVQNVTDVDDPLFERAARDGVDWRELGQNQIALFRSDMTALKVIPPQQYVGAMESVQEVVDMVSQLLDNGSAYIVDDPEFPDVYARVSATSQFGYESNYDRSTMARLFAERGGDPDRAGKKNPLDALLWRAAREGEPSWESPFGPGRPGWHIECAAIASNRLGDHFDIQGGGSDLIFPHHEFSAAHVEAAHQVPRMADFYVHPGMISKDGVKMSKSLGNLEFVSKLLAAGHSPGAIRLGVYSSHYRRDRDWSAKVITQAENRLALWGDAVHRAVDFASAEKMVASLRAFLAQDLATPDALGVVDYWASEVVQSNERSETPTQAGILASNAIDSLFGVPL